MANGPAAGRPETDRVFEGAVREQVQRLLKSPQFASSERLSNFLKFVSEKTLAGESDDIKEYLIATEVYRRGAQYDPKTDSIVRVEASRLRRKLGDYYQASGQKDSMLVELPKGSYVPTFTPRTVSTPEPIPVPVPVEIASEVEPALPPPVSPPEKSSRSWQVAALVAALAILAGTVSFLRNRAPSHADAPRVIPVTSIAVLPLVNLSIDPQDATLADGLTEAITNVLSQSSDLRVTGRTSAYRYKGRPDTVPQIGTELGVGSIVEGSVLRQGDRLRVTVQLVGTADGFHLLSQNFEQVFHDSLAAEREISQAIGRGILDRLLTYSKDGSHQGATTNPEALHLYQKGWTLLQEGATDHLLLPEGQRIQPEGSMSRLLQCIEYFDRAIALDPKYSRAYAGLANAYYVASDYDSSLVAKAQAAADRALQFDTNLPEAFEVLGYLRFLHQWDFAGAERAFRRSLELSPRNVSSHRLYADVTMMLGRPHDAAVQLIKAQEAYPTSPVIATEMAIVSYNLRDYTQMVQQSQALIAKYPNLQLGHWTLGLAYEQQGKLNEAKTELDKCLRISPRNPRCTAAVGHLLGRMGRREEALKLIETYKQRPQTDGRSPYSVALIYMGLGEKDAAFEWLGRAFEQHDTSLPYARIDPRFDPVAKDQRFTALMKKLHLDTVQ